MFQEVEDHVKVSILNSTNLINYLDEKLNDLCQNEEEFNGYKVSVYDELTYDFSADEKEIVVIFKSLVGGITSQTAVMPIQLTIFTEKNSLAITKKLFNRFSELYSNTSVDIDGSQLKQYYTTIVDINNFIESQDGFRSMCYLSATYILIRNSSDLKEIYIDNEKIDFISYALPYTVAPSTCQTNNQKLLRNRKTNASLQLQITIYPKSTIFFNKLRALRTEQLNGSHAFKIKLVFFDNNVEENYNMMVLNSTLAGGNSAAGTYTIVFGLTN